MPRRIDYRIALTRAVDAFLERTPASTTRAHGIIRACYQSLTRQVFTLDDIIWGPLVSALTDSVYYENRRYLTNLHALLSGSSRGIQRVYISYDWLAHDFTLSQQELYTKLLSMLDFLKTNPSEGNEVILTYEQNKAEIESQVAALPLIAHVGEETFYQFVLREVAALVTTIDVNRMVRRRRGPVPAPPYSCVCDSENAEPDISEQLTWAYRALNALQGQSWLELTWQLDANRLLTSLR